MRKFLVYVTATFMTIGKLLVWLITLPFRLIARLFRRKK